MGLKRFFVFFIMGPCALSQQVFDDTALKQDFEVLTKVVIEVAPTLKVSDKAALYTKLNQRKEALTGASMTALDFFIFLKNSAFGISVDEHAGIELPQEVIQSLIPNKPVLFPLPISIQNKKVLVNHEGVGIPFGSVITSINERPISEVLDALMPKVSSRAYRELERQFDLAYLIEYGQNDAFTIEYTAPNTSQTQQVRLEAIDLSTRQSLWEELVYPLNRAQLKNLTNTWYDDTQAVYYLQLNGFDWRAATKNETKAFEKEFTRIFKEIANVNPKQLIVDMRYNGGGKMEIPGLFYSFLATAAFSEVVTAKIPDFDLPYMEYIPMGPEHQIQILRRWPRI